MKQMQNQEHLLNQEAIEILQALQGIEDPETQPELKTSLPILDLLMWAQPVETGHERGQILMTLMDLTLDGKESRVMELLEGPTQEGSVMSGDEHLLGSVPEKREKEIKQGLRSSLKRMLDEVAGRL
jgi:hypothetical protein